MLSRVVVRFIRVDAVPAPPPPPVAPVPPRPEPAATPFPFPGAEMETVITTTPPPPTKRKNPDADLNSDLEWELPEPKKQKPREGEGEGETPPAPQKKEEKEEEEEDDDFEPMIVVGLAFECARCGCASTQNVYTTREKMGNEFEVLCACERADPTASDADARRREEKTYPRPQAGLHSIARIEFGDHVVLFPAEGYTVEGGAKRMRNNQHFNHFMAYEYVLRAVEPIPRLVKSGPGWEDGEDGVVEDGKRHAVAAPAITFDGKRARGITIRTSVEGDLSSCDLVIVHFDGEGDQKKEDAEFPRCAFTFVAATSSPPPNPQPAA